jgi:DnaJ-class molecular chaperone
MFNVIIGDKTKEAMTLMGIEIFPFTESEIKSKFRNLAKKYHPDKLNGDNSSMKKINVAYSHIKYLAIKDNGIAEKGKNILKEEQKNEDIFQLFDTCEKCKGTGEITRYSMAYEVPCIRCREIPCWYSRFKPIPIGKIQVRCGDCRGTGKFKQRNGRIVNCRRCNSKGWLYITCPKCKGRRIIKIEAHTTKTICLNCGGSGRVKINPFNPVIPKGAVL